MKYVPLKCQEEGTEFILDNQKAGLLFIMGLGKTVSCATAIEELMYNYCSIARVLVVAPKRVATLTWPDELEKWDHLNRLTYTVLHGKDKLTRLKTVAKQVDITIINYEGLRWLVNNDDHLPRYDMMVFDESTYVKNPTSGRTKLVHALSRGVGRVVILTGTPKPNGIANLWSQAFLLDRGHRLGSSVTTFRERYMIQKDQRLYVPKQGAKKEVLDLIKDLVLVVEDTSGVGLPDVVERIIDIELPDKARTMYDTLETEFVLDVPDSSLVTVTNQQSMTQKLRQIACGFLYSEDGVIDVHSEKLDALEDIIENTSGNVLVGINFKHEVEMIRKRLGYNVPAIFSETQEKQSTEWMREWMAGKVPVMLANPASMSHGLNMQGGGCNIVWFSMTWDREMWDQFVARLRRRGSQYGSVFNWILKAKGTIEDVMLKVLTTKGIDQESSLEYLREYRRELRRRKGL